MCKQEKDSLEHVLLICDESRQVWCNVENWIVPLGIDDFKITDTKKLVGGLEKTFGINSIIGPTKR